MNYWYDQQIRRYLLQLIRVFSHFSVREYTESGEKYNRVPCKYADPSRMVSQILRSNSENIINSSPQITVGIDNIALSRARSQDPFLVDTKQVAEREWDKQAGQYTSEQGNLYTVQRYMPVPYDLTIRVDLWTTNTDTKLQLLEQIMVLFNPSLQLQSNDNPLDWSNVFEVELTSIVWSNRSIPTGVEDQLDITSMTFEVPIWISPPAKVMKQKIIQKIVADIYTVSTMSDLGYNEAYYDFFSSLKEDARVTITPGDYLVRVENNIAQLLNSQGIPQPWRNIIEMQGELSDISKLELNLTNDMENFDYIVIGSVSEHDTDDTLLNFVLDSDTLPANTLNSVDRIIDPRASTPGVNLPASAQGQRYLITNDIDSSGVWGVSAVAGDILEFNGSIWLVDFNSQTNQDTEWVTNTYTGNQYKWTGSEWISSWQGSYNAGFWRLLL